MPLFQLKSRYSNDGGRMRRLENKVELLWKAITELEAEGGISIRETALGGIAIGGGGGGGNNTDLENAAFMAEARFGEDEHGNEIVEVKMLGGTVQGLFGAIEPIPTTFWTTANKVTLFPDPEEEAGEEEEEEEEDPCEVNKNEDLAIGEWFWLEYDPEEDEYDPETGEGGRWSVEHGQELPESDPPEEGEGPDGRVVYFTVIPLFRISAFAARNVIQNHFGAVYVPTVSNVVPIQKFPEDSQGAQP